ncbi:FimB/Mfa2 family fimbrial subunit [Mucilaginibacter sp. UR6-1]|uniref:FimB/Mfa2 family fimbrial subunit n=1 Tax=Mucilaginibacter sp. UR6-1 TaxID=1435643 RepID=UPI001E51F193|nr:FimB/Mfa2 family fimbrial subunit [Mucilaginibacter sp. UR6-1]MCC8407376.1 FimB/Mfa2 family fimbrial subunit [Mucilaginibacter sp. UR6-1]
MRKIYLIFPLLFLLFAACKKDGKSPGKPDPEEPDTTGKVYTVNFNVGIDANSKTVSGVKNETNKSLTAQSTDLKTTISQLAYYVLDNNGNIITTILQDYDDPNFGIINDTFTTGEYTVVVWGAWGSPPVGNYILRAFGRDIFYKKFNLTVSSSTPAEQQNINLERIVGQLQVKVLDSIPPEAKSINITVSPDYSLNLKTGVVVSPSFETERSATFVDSLIGKQNFTIATNVMNTTKTFTVKIVCTSKTGGLLANITVPNINCLPNKRTILSGRLFTDAKGSFNATFNEAWDPDKEVVQF